MTREEVAEIIMYCNNCNVPLVHHLKSFLFVQAGYLVCKRYEMFGIMYLIHFSYYGYIKIKSSP